MGPRRVVELFAEGLAPFLFLLLIVVLLLLCTRIPSSLSMEGARKRSRARIGQRGEGDRSSDFSQRCNVFVSAGDAGLGAGADSCCVLSIFAAKASVANKKAKAITAAITR